KKPYTYRSGFGLSNNTNSHDSRGSNLSKGKVLYNLRQGNSLGGDSIASDGNELLHAFYDFAFQETAAENVSWREGERELEQGQQQRQGLQMEQQQEQEQQQQPEQQQEQHQVQVYTAASASLESLDELELCCLPLLLCSLTVIWL
ncbi:hypothetical protein Ancab_019040, partial [Ancistrocladus abbreviatus]